MGVREKYAELLRRRDLALRLAARPQGVTLTDLSRSLAVSSETARRMMAELCAEVAILVTVPPSPQGVKSPGRPAKVFRLRKRAA